ncbi:RNA polymerase sigma factor [Paenibacillus sp. J31TS4]|uniref:RNA polymerase sigma factor n=1 Tax=Paenibacillus sp. J31TS4 TaxID=2807195 RepID=UPI001B0B35E9|nr:RNA polymerase sigma factor [Paenibacillus sp. J31TS4]GIP36943.1 RNA polymerase sigma factor [Paenibacillus sp. J31TS4]
MTDEELVRRMADGDQAAFEAFVHRYHGALHRYVERLLGDGRKAEDIVQETLLRLIRQLRTGQVPAAVRPWLYRVASNLCKDYWRSGGYRNELASELAEADRPAHGPSIVEIYERQETRREVLSTLGSLPPAQREIVVLRFYEDKKLQDIAEIVELPLNTVKTNLYSALRKLRGRLLPDKGKTDQKKGGQTYA